MWLVVLVGRIGRAGFGRVRFVGIGFGVLGTLVRRGELVGRRASVVLGEYGSLM